MRKEDLKIGQQVKIHFKGFPVEYGEIVCFTSDFRHVGVLVALRSGVSIPAILFHNSSLYEIEYLPKYKLWQHGFGDYGSFLDRLEPL